VRLIVTRYRGLHPAQGADLVQPKQRVVDERFIALTPGIDQRVLDGRIIAKALIEPNLRSGRLTGKPKVTPLGRASSREGYNCAQCNCRN
jgi:hypothetical protein